MYELITKMATLFQTPFPENVLLPRPLIGIPAPARESEQGPIFSQDAVGIWAVERAAGSALLVPVWPLPPEAPLFQTLWPQLLRFDGLLLPAFVHSDQERWYEQWSTPSEATAGQKWVVDGELAFAQLATMIGMPILAVGDGAEKLNVALGGTLLKDPQPSKKKRAQALPRPNVWPRQPMPIRKSTRLSSLLSFQLVSGIPTTPQQPIEHLAQGLLRSDDAKDASIIAFERPGPVFTMGFLPRIDWALEHYAPLFEAFGKACQAFSRRRQDVNLEEYRDEICTCLSQQIAAQQPLLPPLQPHRPRVKVIIERSPSLSTTHREEQEGVVEVATQETSKEGRSVALLEKRPVERQKSQTGPLRHNHMPTLEELKNQRRLLVHKKKTVKEKQRTVS